MNSRSLVFFTLISFLFLVSGYFLFGRQGLVLGFLFASAFNLYVYFFSEQRLIKHLRGIEFIGQDLWGVQILSNQICIQLHCYKPKIYISKISNPFIFSSSKGWGRSSLIVSEGLLNQLTTDELKDLLTLQIYYTASTPSLFVGFRALTCEVFFILGQFLDLLINLPIILIKGKSYFSPFKSIFGFFASIIQKSFRKDLIKVDAYVSSVIGSKEKFAKLIWKVQSLNAHNPMSAPPSCAIAFPVNPLTQASESFYFQKHLPTEDRFFHLLGSKTV